MGEAGVAASVDADGRLLVVTMPHRVHGQVQLTAAPELPERQRYDQAAVRRYRRRLSARDARSWGIFEPATARGRRVGSSGRPAWLWHEAVPVTFLDVGPTEEPGARLMTLVPHPDDVGGARGVVQVRLGSGDGGRARYAGRLRWARAPYPQLTEGGPLHPVARRPRLERAGTSLTLVDRSLGTAASIGGDLDAGSPDALAVLSSGWLALDLSLERGWRTIVIGLGHDADEAVAARVALSSVDPEALLAMVGRRWSQRWAGWPARDGGLEVIARRGLAYAVGCCAVSLTDGSVGLITDHRLLPLAWTRDGYFVARSFLDWTAATDRPEPVDLVRRHLRWLFEVADRPSGWWARSHLIGGQRKDGVFQADQQLYPLLELADHALETGDRTALAAYAEQVPTILAVLDARADRSTGLIGTDETAADDPTDQPFQAATQILAWRTLRRLAEAGIATSALDARADRLRTAVLRSLVMTVDGRRVLAHATDGRGALVHGHDANDLPFALAAEWGFLAPDDPLWVDTMVAALSATHSAFYAGTHGGLGSPHTPGPWPLGQLQGLIAAHAMGADGLAIADAAAIALRTEAQWDDLLPEASDADTGRPVSRPWFAWPGCLAASVHLTASSTRPATGSPLRYPPSLGGSP